MYVCMYVYIYIYIETIVRDPKKVGLSVTIVFHSLGSLR